MIDQEEKPAWYTLSMIVAGGFVGMFVGAVLGIFIGSVLYQGEGNFLQGMQNISDESFALPMMVLQGSVSIFGFFVFPFGAWCFVRKKRFSDLNNLRFQWLSLPWVLAVGFTFIVAISVIIEWNQHVHFPEFLKSFEQWARMKEDELAETTKLLTQFHSFSDFLIGFVVIAVCAGVCEEMLFRGLIQTELYRGTKNIHVAIWISAILFSAFHVQFFGFVPRLLLGALFGYLYYWSGNIFVPMLAHIINNSLTVIVIYLNQQGMVSDEMVADDSAAPWPAVIVCAIICTALLYYFKNFFEQKKQLGNGR